MLSCSFKDEEVLFRGQVLCYTAPTKRYHFGEYHFQRFLAYFFSIEEERYHKSTI